MATPSRPSHGSRARTALAALVALVVVAVVAYVAVLRDQASPSVQTPAGVEPPPTPGGASTPPPSSSPQEALAASGFAIDLLGTSPAPAPPTGEPPPLVGDEALRWADANGFDRWKARESLAEGLRYYHGQGTPVDFERARASFEVAARYEGRAAYYLAGMYQNGRGVPTDVGASLQWLQRGAQLGDPEAQFALGSACLDGVAGFMVPNVPQGLQWLTLSANQGHRGATDRLSQLRVR